MDDYVDIYNVMLDIIVGSFNIIVIIINKKSGKKIIFVRIIKLVIGFFNDFFVFISNFYFKLIFNCYISYNCLYYEFKFMSKF